jgi:hypothetical protein
MKSCPACQSTYTDDTLQFCLQDGANLVAVSGNPTVANRNNEAETVVVPPAKVTRQVEPKKSSTATVIILTVLATLLLFGGGLGAWSLWRNRGAEVANANVNSVNSNSSNRANKTVANANKGNVNNSPTPAANATATATPNIDIDRVKDEVSDKVQAWASSLEAGNLDTHMNNYADRLDYYYNSRDVGVATVRADKQRAFGQFEDFQMDISNLRVTPDASGEKATAVFDKEWEFEGEENRNKGKSQSQLQLTKIGGTWRITGEKDLKVYYVEK